MFRNDYPSQGNMLNSNVDIVGGFGSLQVSNVSDFKPTALHFDTGSEMIWVGNQAGVVASFYGSPHMQRYTSFLTHKTSAVVDILTYDDRVVTLTNDEVRCTMKRGIQPFTITHPSLTQSHCMTMWKKDGSLLVGGENPGIVQIDLQHEKVIRTHVYPDDEGTRMFRGNSSKYICCGNRGKIVLRDPETLKVVHRIPAHGMLSDFDVSGHTLMSCGFSQPSHAGTMTLDPYIKLYDLRNMKWMNPMRCPLQPHFLRYMSSYTRRMAVFSELGQFFVIEDNAAVTMNTPIYQAEGIIAGQGLSQVEVSESAQAIALTDASGNLHLWSSTSDPTFNNSNHSKPVELATPFTPNHNPMSMDDVSTELSQIPVPQTYEPLLSDWEPQYCYPVSRRINPIDQQIISTMRVDRGIGHAPNNGKRRLNQVPYNLQDNKTTKGKNKNGVKDAKDNADSKLVPDIYQRVTFVYTKLGESETEKVNRANRTAFAGLDPNLQNAYCNCMLQVLHFIEPLRIFLLSHHNMNKQYDLAEEMGFLFHMLDSSKGGILQASNFLRAFRTIHEANALGLIQANTDPSVKNEDLPKLIQNWNRFILQQLHIETKPAEGEKEAIEQPVTNRHRNDPSTKGSIIDKLFGTQLKIKTRFVNGDVTHSTATQFLFNLSYPLLPRNASVENTQPVSFSEILRNSLCQTQPSKTWHQPTSSFIPMTMERSPSTLPEMLVFNCNVTSPETRKFWTIQNELYQQKAQEKIEKEGVHDPNLDRWKQQFMHGQLGKPALPGQPKPSWVPLYISLLIDANQKFHVDSTLDDSSQSEEEKVIDEHSLYGNYELHASVAQVIDPKNGDGLVSHINVSEPYHRRKEGITHTQWYLFNEFTINPIDKEESVDFDLRWKVPMILYYKREDLLNRNPIEKKYPLGPELLLPTPSIAKSRYRRPESNPTISTVPLDPAELANSQSGKGFLVALDAEFVTLNAEEAELHSDGTRSTIKPSQMLPARVTVVRGEGPLEGTPFIDDYIPTQENIVDYLTKFSGIKPGDLDVTLSSKHLSEFKLTYCKLRYLIQQGCVFVGHGLKKDFKVINILVPQQQVRDTVQLFHMPKKRLISLRFLAWYYLDKKIQEDMHDSIEDAVTALRIYKKYLELTDNENRLKVMEFKLEKLPALYEEGRKLEWKVPKD